MSQGPEIIILHIGNQVQQPARSQHISILGVEAPRHNPGLVLARLEMRIGKADKDLAQLAAPEEVGEELHRVGAEGGDVVVAAVDELHVPLH